MNVVIRSSIFINFDPAIHFLVALRGINFAVEFWADGIDDGKNKFSSDVLFIIWRTIKAQGWEIPYPQREVRILGDKPLAGEKA